MFQGKAREIMFLAYPDWLSWTISGLGFVLCVYTLVRWRRSWEACRPMPFKRMRARYIKGLAFALALMMGPYMMAAPFNLASANL